jgi:hypothetical protein
MQNIKPATPAGKTIEAKKKLEQHERLRREFISFALLMNLGPLCSQCSG